MDFHIDISRGAVDRDEDVAFAPLQGGQMFQVDMDEADRRLLKDAGFGFVRLWSSADAVALQAAVNCAARQGRPDTALHHLNNVVQGQLQRCPKLANKRLLRACQADRQLLRSMRAVLNRGSAAPAADGGLADAELGRKLGHRLLAALDVSACPRRRRRIGMQAQLHDPRRSLM
jgi:hypothetical protein